MNILLIGYGKMGKAIEAIAKQRGHTICGRMDSSSTAKDLKDALCSAMVAIEFTNPTAAPGNVSACIAAKVPVVCGSTGWNEKLEEMKRYCKDQGGALLWASNFSIGVNIVFEINKKLAQLLNSRQEYDVTLAEVHHLQKKDAPSGTAITLANQIIAAVDRKDHWSLDKKDGDEDGLLITASREEGVPGTHTITYTSNTDEIQLVHTAINRDGFALGAVLAAEFIADKQGVYDMNEVLGI